MISSCLACWYLCQQRDVLCIAPQSSQYNAIIYSNKRCLGRSFCFAYFLAIEMQNKNTHLATCEIQECRTASYSFVMFFFVVSAGDGKLKVTWLRRSRSDQFRTAWGTETTLNVLINGRPLRSVCFKLDHSSHSGAARVWSTWFVPDNVLARQCHRAPKGWSITKT